MSDLFVDMHQRRFNRSGRKSKVNTLLESPSFSSSSTFNVTHSTSETAADEAKNDEEDPLANTLSLQLRKPKHWKWELSTSRSCANIALPRILLHNHKGELLIDVNTQEEQVIKEDDLKRSQTPVRKRSSRAATSNLAHSIREVLDREFNGLQIGEATPSLQGSLRSSRRSSPASINICSNQLPNYVHDTTLERRSNSLKGVRFNFDDSAKTSSFPIVDLPTPPPSSTNTTNTSTPTTTGTSSSGPREKRRYRRSQSSGRSASSPHSSSILERFSYNKGRFSSPEFEQAMEHEVQHAPRYFLSTSKAGTLVVQEESFNRYRRRRRPRNSSSENILNESGSPKSRSTNSLKTGERITSRLLKVLPYDDNELKAGSLQNVAALHERSKKQQPVRRYCSDGNVLLHKQMSTSEEEEEQLGLTMQQQQEQRRYANFRRQSKRDLVAIDPGNGVLRSVYPNER